jgi:hypothetical protein
MSFRGGVFGLINGFWRMDLKKKVFRDLQKTNPINSKNRRYLLTVIAGCTGVLVGVVNVCKKKEVYICRSRRQFIRL